jgi:hypothetical protein
MAQLEELERLKKLLAIMERTINELGVMVQEVKSGKPPGDDAYKVEISKKKAATWKA